VEFISKTSNFREVTTTMLADRYRKQYRQEMPTLEPDQRFNFNEVELGYQDPEIAARETSRCLECGCSEFHTCDLKKLSTEYNAVQNRFKGEFHQFETDNSHPYIELDNNKCILCARCVRICREIAGACALGLVNRGFRTYIAPSLGDSLLATNCESCGLCISTCPTGAITENVSFKPAPVKWETINTICNYCSVGCAITIHHKGGFVMRVTGAEGKINTDGNICRYARFGYHYMNDKKRIVAPLLKINGKFTEITFEKAFELILEKISLVKPWETAFYGGGRLSNEELYLIQKLARAGFRTGNVNSFHYLGSEGYHLYDPDQAFTFDRFENASRIYLLGSGISSDNPVAGYMINRLHHVEGLPVDLISTGEMPSMEHKVDKSWKITSYYHFIKALNYYCIAGNKTDQVPGRHSGFDEYRDDLLKEDFQLLLELSGICCRECFSEFAEQYIGEMNAFIVFSEKEIDPETVLELMNHSVITGKNGKNGGLVCLKEKNNSQGLIDMRFSSNSLPGGINPGSEAAEALSRLWNIQDLPVSSVSDHIDMLRSGSLKNLLIFCEDPIGCAEDAEMVAGWLDSAGFVVVQDYFMTDTATRADLVLPASFPAESGGSYSNTGKTIQHFEKQAEPATMTGIEQLLYLLRAMGINGLDCLEDIKREMQSFLSLLPARKSGSLVITRGGSRQRLFRHGCDNLVKRFDDEFARSFDGRQI
jgi:formate dehydrogenase major subunit